MSTDLTSTSAGVVQLVVCDDSGSQIILAVPGVQGPTTTVSGAGDGTVTSVGLSVPSGLIVSGSPVTTSGTLAVAFASGHSIPTTASQATWDTAYSERRQWDGGATNLDAASGRTNLGLGTADSPVFAGLTVSGTANLPHIHGALAGVLYEHVRNTSGAPISALTPYHVTGSQGDTDRVTIEPAQANNAALMPAAGITYGALSTNEDGHGAVGGVITGLNTIGFQSGDPVYVAPSGGLTATRPASGIVQAVGVIGRVHASTGSMAVLIGSALQAVAFSGAYGDLSGRPTIPSGADAVPQALGTAAVGVSNDYAREDHVHAMPTAGQVGADAAGTAVATVSGHVAAADPHTQYALESSLATVATSGAYGDLSGLPAIPSGADAVPQALGIAAVGVSSDYAREDHVHAMPTAADVGAAASGHVHGNITNAGAIGSVSGAPIITGASGVLQAGSFGTASGTFAQGNDARFHDSVTLSASVADILNLSGQELQADDPGDDRLLFWDDSESKLAHLQLGTNLSITGTTLNAAGGGGASFNGYAVGNWIAPVDGPLSQGLAVSDTNVLLSPCMVKRSIRVSELGCRITTGAAGSTFQLAIYASSNGLPTGLPLASTGDLSSAALGNITAAVTPFNMTGGELYWMGISCTSASVQTVNSAVSSSSAAALIGAPTLGGLFGSSTSYGFSRNYAATYGTWPNLTGVTTTLQAGVRGALVFLKVDAFL